MIVVDASVVANALADDGQDGHAARSRLLQADHLLAPDLIDVETMSVFRRRWLVGALTADRFAHAVGDLIALPVERVPMRSLISRAFDLRANVTPYDAMYVALAEGLGCALLTADRRLADSPGVRCEVEVLTLTP
ncbi:type II toxin-antitoxin system VapC family toxin [Microbacterium sp. C23T]